MSGVWQRSLGVFLATCIVLAPTGQPPTPQSRPTATPPLPPGPGVLLDSDRAYVPSGISIEDLPRERPLVNLNLRLPAQDPLESSLRTAATLRAHGKDQGPGPTAAAPPSAEIQALAAGLNHDPKLIFEYLHNHFDFLPNWGQMKSPEQTVLDKLGNPFDQAALLAALLQASGYETRYVWGVVRVPVAAAMNWVGVRSAQVLPHVFWNGGVAAQVQGDALVLEHIWVKVQVDGTWHPLDPSFKAYTYEEGMDLAGAMGYNQSAFLSAAQSGATVTDQYVRQINETNINARLAGYSNSLVQYLRGHEPFASLDEVAGGREIVAETVTALPTQLPYTVQSVSGESADMPAAFQYKLRVEMPGLNYQANLSDLAGKRITIFYVGATAADQDKIRNAGGIYNVYPAYQVNMKPELRVGGNLAATGSPLPLASWQPITPTVVTPILDDRGNAWTVPFAPQWLQAGAWYAIPLMLETVSPEALRQQHKALAESRAAGLAMDSEPVLGQALYTMGLSYLNQSGFSDQLDARIADVAYTSYMKGMLMSQDLRVTEWQQVSGVWQPMRVGPAAYSIDVRLVWGAVASRTGDSDRERGFMLDSGHKGSAIEHATIEQLQENPALSTIQVLDIANSQGLKIYHIISTTVETVLPLLDYPAQIKDSLRADVMAGYQVTVPERNITYNQWTGTGWISLDVASGSSGYWLNGRIGSVPEGTSVPAVRLGGSGSQTGTVNVGTFQNILGDGPLTSTWCNPGPTGCDGTASPNGSDDPVDTGTGSYVYGHTDLEFGIRGFPVRFSRVYVSSRHRQDGPLGFGWTHSYDMRLVKSSDWTRGFGFRTAVDAAAAVAEAYVGVDIASTAAGGLPHERIVVGTEAADWGLAQLTKNVITVTGPEGSRYQYLALSDGSYRPPHGTFSTLVKNPDTTFTVQGKDGSRITFNAQGKVTSLSDAYGNQTTLAYDAAGLLTRVTDAVGRKIDLTYTGGRLTQMTDPAGRVFRYQYDSLGNLTRYTNARGGATSYAYDADHRMTTVTDPTGQQFVTNAYDPWGRVTRQTNSLGGVTTFLYGDVRTTVVDPAGFRATYLYDAKRRLVAVQDDRGHSTQVQYDAHDNTLAIVDKKGNVSRLTYDERGNLTTYTTPLGDTTTFAYDDASHLIQVTNPLGQSTRFIYEGRTLARVVNSLGETTTYAYDAAGWPTRVTDPNGHARQLEYDAHGNLTRIVDPLGNAMRMTYDVVGRLTGVTDASGNTVQLTFDANDNLTTAVNPLGGQTRFTYDANDHWLTVTDARGNTTRYAFEHLVLLTVTDAEGHTTRYGYSPAYDLVEVTDANGHRRTYERDDTGRVTRTVDALGRVSRFIYDANGNVAERHKADGSVVRYEYDALNRPIRVSYPDGGQVTYSYDRVGRLLSATFGSWEARYEYDAQHRLTGVAYPKLNRSIRYTYDGAGNRLTLRVLAGEATVYDARYDYDAADRLTGVTFGPDAARFALNYDVRGNLISVDHHGKSRTLYTYNSNNWTSQVQTFDGQGALTSALTYTYDEVGNPIGIVHTTPGGSLAKSYTYDRLDRLVQERHPRYTVEYAYDAVGNRTQMASPLGIVAYRYDAADQLLSAGTTTFTYDANGNQTSRTDALGTTAYAYDLENRLVTVTSPDGSTQRLVYDPMGRPVATEGPEGRTLLTYDGSDLILEDPGAPAQGTTYVYADHLLLARYAPTADPAAGSLSYHGDAVGSVRQLVDAEGTARDAYSYDAFGHSHRPAGVVDNPYLYIGQLGVRAIGSGDLFLMGLRPYDASTGRFLTAEPIPGDPLLPSSLHPYVYARNNPLRFVDPLGLSPLDDFDDARERSGVIVATGAVPCAVVIYVFSEALKAVNEGASQEEAWNRAWEKGYNIAKALDGVAGAVPPWDQVKSAFENFLDYVEGRAESIWDFLTWDNAKVWVIDPLMEKLGDLGEVLSFGENVYDSAESAKTFRNPTKEPHTFFDRIKDWFK